MSVLKLSIRFDRANGSNPTSTLIAEAMVT
jgi:hypothetical protein